MAGSMVRGLLFIMLYIAFGQYSIASEIISPGSEWRYFDAADVSSNWYQVNFDDNHWPIGRAQLGYGEGDEVTITKFGPNQADKYPVQYFRINFLHIEATTDKVVLRMLVDDGARVYLNGEVIFEVNLSPNNKAQMLAVNSLIEHVWIEVPLNDIKLNQGENTLAVSVHQLSHKSSDLSFDLALISGSNISQVPLNSRAN
ncbi:MULTISPECIES: hypothetical protein [unclassified Shewanella]|uniref:hypothetical protein n=1 Tax=unclassified Shewanella TaxID=196818 RepID=UPI001BC79E40|nr:MULTISPECIES: hypothetical protein [unclassified Shewanella]GIU12002.1 hypothetical protein TUM4444_18890 [Shewanella sp. MBTL60-112-B1]GIU31803.1 hypothetical protein TUM4445_16720 [Shewanella sp. MBTL60-112-B2]